MCTRKTGGRKSQKEVLDEFKSLLEYESGYCPTIIKYNEYEVHVVAH